MAQFSLVEQINGLYNLFKSEFVDAKHCRAVPPPDVDVTGRVVLMTGGTSGKNISFRIFSRLSQGIGKETARRLAMSGAHLIITARDEKRGNRCVAELIEESRNPNIEFLYLDLCDFKSIELISGKLLEEVRHIDVLLNCAGLGYIDSWMMTKDGNELMYVPSTFSQLIQGCKLIIWDIIF